MDKLEIDNTPLLESAMTVIELGDMTIAKLEANCTPQTESVVTHIKKVINLQAKVIRDLVEQNVQAKELLEIAYNLMNQPKQ